MSGFFLEKWYLDAADQRGNVYIGYWASLRWLNISLHYYQHLWHTDTDGVQTRGGFAAQPKPQWHLGDRLCWEPHNVRAVWQSAACGWDETLLCTDQGHIRWKCTQPKARAHINLPQLSFTGWGYSECIEITIPAWNLPLETLYWGRCHSDGHYLVWIKWEGPTQLSLLWHNGRRFTELEITDSHVCGPDVQLELGENTTLRQGSLGTTVFRSFEQILQLFPQKSSLIYEQKWYNLGRLVTRTDREKATTIYERVDW